MAPSPYSLLEEIYRTELCARSLPEDIFLHILNGWVYSDPEVLVMGRPVCRHAPYVQITDPAYTFSNPDTWLVYAAAGDVSRALRLIPYELPYLGYERLNKLRFFPFRKVVRDFGLPACHLFGPHPVQGRRQPPANARSAHADFGYRGAGRGGLAPAQAAEDGLGLREHHPDERDGREEPDAGDGQDGDGPVKE